jgi:hypothetical protein
MPIDRTWAKYVLSHNTAFKQSAFGSRTIHAGLCLIIDRNDRRDLSIFQIDLRFFQRKKTNDFSVSIPLSTYI